MFLLTKVIYNQLKLLYYFALLNAGGAAILYTKLLNISLSIFSRLKRLIFFSMYENHWYLFNNLPIYQIEHASAGNLYTNLDFKYQTWYQFLMKFEGIISDKKAQ